MLTIYQKILIAALIAAFGGEFIIFYLKKLLVGTNVSFAFDLSGIIERTALILLIFVGSYYIFFIPIIVIVRALFMIGKSQLRALSYIIKREEPAVQFQKIRIKSELAVTLLASPLLGIIFGILAKVL